MLETLTDDEIRKAASVKAPLSTISGGELLGAKTIKLENLSGSLEVQLLIESTVARNLVRSAMGASLNGSFFTTQGFEYRNMHCLSSVAVPAPPPLRGAEGAGHRSVWFRVRLAALAEGSEGQASVSSDKR
jgi:hypothetical protein